MRRRAPPRSRAPAAGRSARRRSGARPTIGWATPSTTSVRARYIRPPHSAQTGRPSAMRRPSVSRNARFAASSAGVDLGEAAADVESVEVGERLVGERRERTRARRPPAPAPRGSRGSRTRRRRRGPHRCVPAAPPEAGARLPAAASTPRRLARPRRAARRGPRDASTSSAAPLDASPRPRGARPP